MVILSIYNFLGLPHLYASMSEFADWVLLFNPFVCLSTVVIFILLIRQAKISQCLEELKETRLALQKERAIREKAEKSTQNLLNKLSGETLNLENINPGNTPSLTWLNAKLKEEIAQRQRTEERLQLTQFSVDRSADAVFWISSDAQFFYVNDAACQSLGYSPEELLSLSIHDINPDFSEAAWSLHWNLLRRCGSISIEAHHRTKSGRMFPVEITINHLEFNGKEYHCAFARDITERKLVEEALRAGQEEFKSLVANIPGAVYRSFLDSHRTMSFISNGIGMITGYPPRDLMQNKVFSFISLIYPEDRERVINTIEQAMKVSQPYLMEYRMIRADSSIRWVSEKGQAIISEEGEVLWLNGLIFDITEQKQASEALRESEERLQLALAGADQGLWDWNLVTGEVYFSPHWGQMLGYTPEQVEGHISFWMKRVHPDDRLAVLRALKEHSLGNTSCMEVEHRILTESEEWKWILNHGKAVSRDDTGKPLRMTGTAKDISARKQAEEALRQSELRERERAVELEKILAELRRTQAQLVQTEKMSSLGQMVAGVAHEINNPVSFIYGNLNYASQYITELLQLIKLYQQSYPENREIKDYLATIELDFLMQDLPKILTSMKLGADRIREIVLSLRNFARLDESEQKPVDIHEGINNTLLLLQNRLNLSNSNEEIAVIKNYGKLPLIECYPGQLNQVFLNLLNNSIDALEESQKQQSVNSWKGAHYQLSGSTRCYPSAADYQSCVTGSVLTEDQPLAHGDHPRIEISTEILNGEWMRLRIADNGIGMTEEVQRRLFDPFFTTKPVGQGTGLGLAICYQIIVEKHRGHLWCRSVLGAGSEFIVEIPIKL